MLQTSSKSKREDSAVFTYVVKVLLLFNFMISIVHAFKIVGLFIFVVI